MHQQRALDCMPRALGLPARRRLVCAGTAAAAAALPQVPGLLELLVRAVHQLAAALAAPPAAPPHAAPPLPGVAAARARVLAVTPAEHVVLVAVPALVPGSRTRPPHARRGTRPRATAAAPAAALLPVAAVAGGLRARPPCRRLARAAGAQRTAPRAPRCRRAPTAGTRVVAAQELASVRRGLTVDAGLWAPGAQPLRVPAACPAASTRLLRRMPHRSVTGGKGQHRSCNSCWPAPRTGWCWRRAARPAGASSPPRPPAAPAPPPGRTGGCA